MPLVHRFMIPPWNGEGCSRPHRRLPNCVETHRSYRAPAADLIPLHRGSKKAVGIVAPAARDLSTRKVSSSDKLCNEQRHYYHTT